MAVLTPNDNSALSKFQYVQQLMSYNNPDSTAKARAYAQSPLISFITLKYGQASLTDQATYKALFNEVIAEINCFVGVYTIPQNNGAVAIALPDSLGGVYFPPGFCPNTTCAGVNVTLDEQIPCTSPGLPAGCVQPLGTLLDKYGIYLKVTLSGDTQHIDTTLSATVGLCSPDGLSPQVLSSLLVGHENNGYTDAGNFQLLNFAPIPSQLAGLLSCTPLQTAQASGMAGSLASFIRHVADALLPEQLHAMFFATSGIGGTTKTFSPFTLTSSTLTATGGLGGSTKSFSPAKPGASAPAKPAASAPSTKPSLTTSSGALEDTAGAVWTTNPALPGITVKTQAGTPIPGVTLTFTVNDPGTAPYKDTPSLAFVCDSSSAGATLKSSVTATTNDTGFAHLNCLNFGTKTGYKNLKVVIDPSSAYPVLAGGGANIVVTACTAPGSCSTTGSTTTELNWLVQTDAGNPASLAIVANTMPTTATAGVAFNPQPQIQVMDSHGNKVPTSGLAIGASVATQPTGATGGLIGGTSANTDATGLATYSSLGIGGTAGPWTIKFTLTGSSPEISDTSGTVTVSAGDAALITTYMPPGPTKAQTYTYTSGLSSGSNASPAPQVLVTDSYGNPVGAGVGLTWTPEIGDGSSLSVGAGGTTTSNGTAQVSSWTFGDGLNQLFANITAVPSGTAALFSATTPTGIPVYSCSVGGSKTDLVPWSLPGPNNSSIKKVTINMSVTGQSSSVASYPAVLTIKTGGFGGTTVRTVNGSVTLPGNNGSPTPVTFTLGTALPKGQGTLYFQLAVTAPSTRKMQVWYTTSVVKNSDCDKVLLYPSYPTLTPTLKGLGIQLTN